MQSCNLDFIAFWDLFEMKLSFWFPADPSFMASRIWFRKSKKVITISDNNQLIFCWLGARDTGQLLYLLSLTLYLVQSMDTVFIEFYFSYFTLFVLIWHYYVLINDHFFQYFVLEKISPLDNLSSSFDLHNYMSIYGFSSVVLRYIS